jgi:hypothetical protein
LHLAKATTIGDGFAFVTYEVGQERLAPAGFIPAVRAAGARPAAKDEVLQRSLEKEISMVGVRAHFEATQT